MGKSSRALTRSRGPGHKRAAPTEVDAALRSRRLCPSVPYAGTAPNAKSRSRYMTSLARQNSGSRFAVICSYAITTPSSQTYLVSAAGPTHLPVVSSVPSGGVSLQPL